MNNQKLVELMGAWLVEAIRSQNMKYPIEIVATDASGYMLGLKFEEDGSHEISCQTWDRPVCLYWPLTVRIFDSQARTQTLVISNSCDSHNKSSVGVSYTRSRHKSPVPSLQAHRGPWLGLASLTLLLGIN
jgi:hypothetical protein